MLQIAIEKIKLFGSLQWTVQWTGSGLHSGGWSVEGAGWRKVLHLHA